VPLTLSFAPDRFARERHQMRCPSCMAENAATRRFCAECGAQLPSPCANCGFENAPTAKFCGGCGSSIREAVASLLTPRRQAPRVDGGERRRLMVMFRDLVGSTALASRLDPEDLREVIRAYHHAVAQIVAGSDGFVAKYTGDGVLVYFGYPRAHEDDPERAARAGLSLIDAVGRLDVKSVKLRGRVGIATGLVVVGDLIGEGSAQEQSVIGETRGVGSSPRRLARPLRRVGLSVAGRVFAAAMGLRYGNRTQANKETASQIMPQIPSDNSTIAISVVPTASFWAGRG
jgi:class 3 adenylate cyclase